MTGRPETDDTPDAALAKLGEALAVRLLMLPEHGCVVRAEDHWLVLMWRGPILRDFKRGPTSWVGIPVRYEKLDNPPEPQA